MSLCRKSDWPRMILPTNSLVIREFPEGGVGSSTYMAG